MLFVLNECSKKLAVELWRIWLVRDVSELRMWELRNGFFHKGVRLIVSMLEMCKVYTTIQTFGVGKSFVLKKAAFLFYLQYYHNLSFLF